MLFSGRIKEIPVTGIVLCHSTDKHPAVVAQTGAVLKCSFGIIGYPHIGGKIAKIIPQSEYSMWQRGFVPVSATSRRFRRCVHRKLLRRHS